MNLSYRFVLCSVAALLLIVPHARAGNTADQTVTYTFTLTGGSYETGGGSPSITGLGGFEVDELITEIGDGTQSGSASVLLNGSAAFDPDDFSFGVGDSIEATLVSQAMAGSVGSIGGHGFDLKLFFDFEDLADPTRNVLLNFDWSYTRNYSLTNMSSGNESAADIFSAGQISNFSSFFQQVFTVDELTENMTTGTLAMSPSDSGSFQLLMDTEGGTEPTSIVEYSVVAGASAIFGVILPGDYSFNGTVGPEDYTIWADDFGMTGPGLAADGSGNEIVGPEDYTIWADNFGMSTGSGPQAVPEPSAFVLAALGMLGLLTSVRRPKRA